MIDAMHPVSCLKSTFMPGKPNKNVSSARYDDAALFCGLCQEKSDSQAKETFSTKSPSQNNYRTSGK